MKKIFKLLRSKTVWSGILFGAVRVAADPHNLQAWGEAAGIALGGAGVRDAIDKAATVITAAQSASSKRGK